MASTLLMTLVLGCADVYYATPQDNLTATIARVRSSARNPLFLPGALAQAVRLQAAYPGNLALQRLFEDLSAARTQLVEKLEPLQARLAERRNLAALAEVTSMLATRLAAQDTAPPADPEPRLPPFRLAILAGASALELGHARAIVQAARFQTFIAHTEHDAPHAHLTVRLAVPRFEFLWRRGTPRTASVLAAERYEWTDNPLRAALEGEEVDLRAEALASPEALVPAIRLAEVRAKMHTMPPRVVERCRRYASVRTVEHRLQATLRADALFAVPMPGAAPVALPHEVASSLERTIDAWAQGDTPRGGVPSVRVFTPQVERSLTDEARATLYLEFCEKVRTLAVAHMQAVARAGALPPAIAAEWQMRAALAADDARLPASFQTLLDAPDLVLADEWRPAALPEFPEPLPAHERPQGDAGWCRVLTPQGTSLGIVIGPCLVATDARCAQTPAEARLTGPDGTPTRAFLWVWDRGRNFAIFRTGLESAAWPQAPLPGNLPLPAGLAQARAALPELLPLGFLHEARSQF